MFHKYGYHTFLYACCIIPISLYAGGAASASGLDGAGIGQGKFTSAPAKFGKALEINGSSDCVSLPGGTTGPLSFPAGSSFTITARIKTSGAEPGPFVIAGYSTKTLDHDIWLAVASGKLEFNALSPNTVSFTPGTHRVNDGTWHNVALVVDGSTATSYVDGTKDAVFTYADYAGDMSAGTAFIGGWPDTQNYFRGEIDEVAVYDAALTSPGTINPNKPIAKGAPGLIALYHLDNDYMDSCANVRPVVKAVDAGSINVHVDDTHIVVSPYNWYRNSSAYLQSPNPGAYLKVGFTGTSLSLGVDVSPETAVNLAKEQYPVVRYSIDYGPAVTLQLTPSTRQIDCAAGLRGGNHNLYIQYIAGYVFEDFWTPVNVVRLTGFTVDGGAGLIAPFGAGAAKPRNILCLGDSITNADDNVATFSGGITNAVGTQDAEFGYVPPIAAALGAEYGVVAYGGASWDGGAADGHTPGLMTFYNSLDSAHSRLVEGKFSPAPSDIFINMGENNGPRNGDVSSLLASLRTASSSETNIFVIVPFSGRRRTELTDGVADYQKAKAGDKRVYLLDTGDCPFLTDAGPTMLSVDGQHPLTALDALLAAEIVQARTEKVRR